jgi:hypothetical protein
MSAAATPMFDADDLDWAVGELLQLFERANRCGIYPHVLAPMLFREAWALLCEQPFDVREHYYGLLMSKITRPLYSTASFKTKKRYAYVMSY